MDRAYSPDETFDRVSPYLKQFGITRVARHTGLDRIGIPVWCAYTPNSRSIVVAQGKGLTDADARVSAVMEALERAVAGSPAVGERVANKKTLLAEGAVVEPLPELLAIGQLALREDEPSTWLPGRDLIRDTQAYIPRDAAILDRTKHENRYWMSSDGLASGNTIEEAILHGMLERIERDAFVLWQVTAPKSRYVKCVDPASFPSTSVNCLADMFSSAGMVFRLFDITSDIGVPTFTCFLAPKEVRTARNMRCVEVTYGCGSHPDVSRATIRAMTEAAQSRITFISGARDDAYRHTFEQSLPDETRMAFEATPVSGCHGYAQPDGNAKSLLHNVLACLRAAKVPRVIAVPLSASGLPFSVVKTFIPALENPDDIRARRFGPRALSKALLS